MALRRGYSRARWNVIGLERNCLAKGPRVACCVLALGGNTAIWTTWDPPDAWRVAPTYGPGRRITICWQDGRGKPTRAITAFLDSALRHQQVAKDAAVQSGIHRALRAVAAHGQCRGARGLRGGHRTQTSDIDTVMNSRGTAIAAGNGGR